MRMAVTMAAFPAVALLLLCCSSTVASTDSCDLYAETNKDFTVPLGINMPNLAQLQWSKDGTVLFRRRQQKVYTGAAEAVTPDGSLKLKKVSKDNAGTYTPEAFGANGLAVPNTKITKLCVMDPVPKPSLKIDCTSKGIKVTCNVPQKTKDLNFAWVQNGNVLKDKKDWTLELKTNDLKETVSFSCNVSNKVSSLASETVQQTCIKFGFLPKTILGYNTWYFVGGGGGVVLLLIILVIFCCVRMRRKKTMRVKDEEELRLGWTNPNQQHHHHQHGPGPAPNQHHHHHHHQQQPAGHTGPRQHRSKAPRSQQRPSRDPAQPNGQPQPSPRRAAQVPRPADTADDEKPPPLPQPRKKAPKTPRV